MVFLQALGMFGFSCCQLGLTLVALSTGNIYVLPQPWSLLKVDFPLVANMNWVVQAGSLIVFPQRRSLQVCPLKKNWPLADSLVILRHLHKVVPVLLQDLMLAFLKTGCLVV